MNGSTGESLSLTVEERKKLTEEWIEVAAGRYSEDTHPSIWSFVVFCLIFLEGLGFHKQICRINMMPQKYLLIQ